MKKRNLIIIITSFLAVILIITIVIIKGISPSNKILILNTYLSKSENTEKRNIIQFNTSNYY
jgi:hypothetical protein